MVGTPALMGCQVTASKTVTCEKVEGGNGIAFRTTFCVFINLTLDHIESRFERNQLCDDPRSHRQEVRPADPHHDRILHHIRW
jgi:hypothetical protein